MSLATLRRLGMHACGVSADNDFCGTCVATTPQGTKGHVFWDELELKKHGLADRHCRHRVAKHDASAPQRQQPPSELPESTKGRVTFKESNDQDKKKRQPVVKVLSQEEVLSYTLPKTTSPQRTSSESMNASELNRRFERCAASAINAEKRRMRSGKYVQASDDFCNDCAANTPRGTLGHTFWDELELMRHGWCDQHCSHWSKVQGRDELQLLHAGKIDRIGHHGVLHDDQGLLYEGMSPVKHTNSAHEHVRFQKDPTTIDIPAPPVNVSEVSSETKITFAAASPTSSLEDLPYKPEMNRQDFVVRGGRARLSMMQLNDTRAAMLSATNHIVYLERNNKQRSLITSTRDGPEDPWLSRRLEIKDKD